MPYIYIYIMIIFSTEREKKKERKRKSEMDRRELPRRPHQGPVNPFHKHHI